MAIYFTALYSYGYDRSCSYMVTSWSLYRMVWGSIQLYMVWYGIIQVWFQVSVYVQQKYALFELPYPHASNEQVFLQDKVVEEDATELKEGRWDCIMINGYSIWMTLPLCVWQRWCFRTISVWIVSGWRQARWIDMVSLPLEKMCSTATAEPKKSINRGMIRKWNAMNLGYKEYHKQGGIG